MILEVENNISCRLASGQNTLTVPRGLLARFPQFSSSDFSEEAVATMHDTSR